MLTSSCQPGAQVVVEAHALPWGHSSHYPQCWLCTKHFIMNGLPKNGVCKHLLQVGPRNPPAGDLSKEPVCEVAGSGEHRSIPS